MNTFQAASIFLSVIVAASCTARGTSNASDGIQDSAVVSSPTSFFAFLKDRVIIEGTIGTSINSAAIATVEARKQASTKAAQEEISKLRSAEMVLPEDCYADMVCFNEEMAISIANKYGTDWSGSLRFLEQYFAAALEDIRNADVAVERAVDVEMRLSQLLLRDKLLRQIYGETLNDPSLEAHSLLTRDLGVGWIRSQVRERDIAASDWLMTTVLNLPEIDKTTILEKSWLIIQHADRRPALQDIAVAALKTSSFPQMHAKEWAMLVDRLELNLGKPQVYATQVRCIDGEFRFSPTVDDSAVDQRRASLGIGPLRGDMSSSLGPC